MPTLGKLSVHCLWVRTRRVSYRVRTLEQGRSLIAWSRTVNHASRGRIVDDLSCAIRHAGASGHFVELDDGAMRCPKGIRYTRGQKRLCNVCYRSAYRASVHSTRYQPGFAGLTEIAAGSLAAASDQKRASSCAIRRA